MTCALPLVDTIYKPFIDGCGLYCDAALNEVASVYTNSNEAWIINLIILCVAGGMGILTLIFTVNTISEHIERWKEGIYDDDEKPPVTYDALFVIDGCYLIVCLCLIIPYLDSIIGGNSLNNETIVSGLYICNTDENSLSLGNPFNASNGISFLFGILLYSGIKLGMLYSGLLCLNLFYRLWRPLQKLGMDKRWIHGSVILTVVMLDIFVIIFNGIDANPTNGLSYISPNGNIYLFIFCEIVPNIIYLLVSFPSILFAVKSLRRELILIRSAEMVFNDLVNLIHRLMLFLALSTFSTLYILFVDIYWLAMRNEFDKSSNAWIDCVNSQISDGYTSSIGDNCHDALKSDYLFPPFWVFTPLPILSLLNIASVIFLTCHRRQSERWVEGTKFVGSRLGTLRRHLTFTNRRKQSAYLTPKPSEDEESVKDGSSSNKVENRLTINMKPTDHHSDNSIMTNTTSANTTSSNTNTFTKSSVKGQNGNEKGMNAIVEEMSRGEKDGNKVNKVNDGKNGNNGDKEDSYAENEHGNNVDEDDDEEEDDDNRRSTQYDRKKAKERAQSKSQYASVIIHSKTSIASRSRPSNTNDASQVSRPNESHSVVAMADINSTNNNNNNDNNDNNENEDEKDEKGNPVGRAKNLQMRQLSADLDYLFKEQKGIDTQRLHRQNTYDRINSKLLELELKRQINEEKENEMNEIVAKKLLTRSHTDSGLPSGSPDAPLPMQMQPLSRGASHRSETDYSGMADGRGRRISKTNEAKEARLHEVESKQKEEFFDNNPKREWDGFRYDSVRNKKRGSNRLKSTLLNLFVEKRKHDINKNTEFWEGRSNGGTLYKILHQEALLYERFTPSAMLEPFVGNENVQAAHAHRIERQKEREKRREKQKERQRRRDDKKKGKSPRSSNKSSENRILRALSQTFSFGAQRTNSNVTMRVVSSATDNDNDNDTDIENQTTNIQHASSGDSHYAEAKLKPGLQFVGNYLDTQDGQSSATTTVRSMQAMNSGSNILSYEDETPTLSPTQTQLTMHSTNVDDDNNNNNNDNRMISNDSTNVDSITVKLNAMGRSKSTPYGRGGGGGSHSGSASQSSRLNVPTSTRSSEKVGARHRKQNGLEFQIGDTSLRVLLQKKLLNITGSSNRSIASEPGALSGLNALNALNASNNVDRMSTLSVDAGYRSDNEDDIVQVYENDENKDDKDCNDEKTDNMNGNNNNNNNNSNNNNNKTLQLSDVHSDNTNQASNHKKQDKRELRKVKSQYRVHFNSDIIEKEEKKSSIEDAGFLSSLGDIDFVTKKKLNCDNGAMMKHWNLKNDKSVNGISSDGLIVIGRDLTDLNIHGRAVSDPVDSNDKLKKEKSLHGHNRIPTLQELLLDDIPIQDRKHIQLKMDALSMKIKLQEQPHIDADKRLHVLGSSMTLKDVKRDRVFM